MNRKSIIIAGIIAVAAVIIGAFIFANVAGADNIEKQMKLGNKYLSEGKYEEAILAFEKVIKIDTKNVEARIGLGKAYKATKQFEKAETVLKEALEIDNKKVEAYLELADCYELQNKKSSAIELLELGYGLTKNENMKKKLNELTTGSTVENNETAQESTPAASEDDKQNQDSAQTGDDGLGKYPKVETGVIITPSTEGMINNIKKQDPNVFAGIDISIDAEKLPESIKKDIKGATFFTPYAPITMDMIQENLKYLVNRKYDFADFAAKRTVACTQEGSLYISVIFLGENNEIIGIYYNPEPIEIKKKN